jgi:hypothetical protein
MEVNFKKRSLIILIYMMIISSFLFTLRSNSIPDLPDQSVPSEMKGVLQVKGC